MIEEEQFLAKLWETFQVEAEEHLQAIADALLRLEQSPPPAETASLVEQAFREMHSLKGAARAVNLGEAATLCQSMETTLADWKKGRLSPEPSLFDQLHRGLDQVRALLTIAPTVIAPTVREPAPMIEPEEQTPVFPPDQSTPINREGPLPPGLLNAVHGPISRVPGQRDLGPQTNEAPLFHAPSFSETIRVSATKLDQLLLEAEELLSAKLAWSQRTGDLREILVLLEQWRKEQRASSLVCPASQETLHRNAGSPATSKSGSLREWDQNVQATLASRLASLELAMQEDVRFLSGMVDQLLEEAKKLLLLPSATLLSIFPKLVRDLSREQKKEVELRIQGGEVEIDKRILEEIKDPLIHLLRNAIDHGVELPESRIAAGKPSTGTIRLHVTQVGNKVEVLVADDGAGIDPRQVLASAVSHGLLGEEESQTLSEREAMELVFRSDVSTKERVTEISGRGLGLAIVREGAEKLGGQASVESKLGQGSSFRLLLPITLARFRGVLVSADGRMLVIPTAYVERVLRVRQEEVHKVEGKEMLALGEEPLALVRLADVLEFVSTVPETVPAAIFPVLILTAAGERIAFQVDQVHSEQEVLVKSLGKQLARVRNVAGATVLGTGRIAPILNVPDLLKSARITLPRAVALPGAIELPRAKMAGTAPRQEPVATKRRRASILVVEDSITSRMLLKNILEAAGYSVRTAVDGMDGWTALKSEPSDLVVSDVDMPRMDGFALTQAIRGDPKVSNLPVVLVTGKETREDRERGIDAGANAYIIKSSFDQGNLLEVIRGLL
ncbi:MAG: hybrid sensor histidine kinase/response regulator [Coprothermobacterota bacterium]|nr:hybrid sensor histidine kinase/response regulator [Coprothermobacterota bacterium]